MSKFFKSKTIKKRALITGITGQDGSYLAEFLADKGYEVFGMVRRTSTEPLLRIADLYRDKKIILLNGDIRDASAVERVITESSPNEIYNFAAQSDVGISFICPEETMDINYYGVGSLIKSAFKNNPKTKIYQASSSEMFGESQVLLNEKSAFKPVTPYGHSKLKAYKDYVLSYRKKGFFICSGIVFNHESPRRGKHFVTRKITNSLAKIKLGLQDSVELGNLDAKRDWGFAGDYVEAMWKMLQRKKPLDFIIATGESHTVREFFEIAAQVLSIDITWHGSGLKEVAKDQDGKVILKINKRFYRPTEIGYLSADISRAKKILKWQPAVSFKNLVKMMVDADLDNESHLS